MLVSGLDIEAFDNAQLNRRRDSVIGKIPASLQPCYPLIVQWVVGLLELQLKVPNETSASLILQ